VVKRRWTERQDDGRRIVVTLTKIDPKKTLKELYRPPTHPVLIDVPTFRYLMIDGDGPPSRPAFQSAIQALYSVAYTLKFSMKRSGIDVVVMPLEALWWSAEGSIFTVDEQQAWRWTAMIMEPDEVTHDLVERTRAEVAKKKELPALESLRFEELDERLAVQMMHVGPYAEEARTLEAMHTFIADEGLHTVGKHHEIYLGDPRRTAPGRLRTVLRQPVSS
jgi:hypothetical protein